MAYIPLNLRCKRKFLILKQVSPVGFKVTNCCKFTKTAPKSMPKMQVIAFPESSFQYFPGGDNSLTVIGEPMKTHDVKYRPNYFYAVSCLCGDESRNTHQSPFLITKITIVPMKDVFIYFKGEAVESYSATFKQSTFYLDRL